MACYIKYCRRILHIFSVIHTFLNGIGLDLLNLDTDLLELDLADTTEVDALQSGAPCKDPPYFLLLSWNTFLSPARAQGPRAAKSSLSLIILSSQRSALICQERKSPTCSRVLTTPLTFFRDVGVLVLLCHPYFVILDILDSYCSLVFPLIDVGLSG